MTRDLDLTETSVRRWVAQAEIDAGRKPGLTSGEQVEMARLRRENRVLCEERDILKRAISFLRTGRSITIYRLSQEEQDVEALQEDGIHREVVAGHDRATVSLTEAKPR